VLFFRLGSLLLRFCNSGLVFQNSDGLDRFLEGFFLILIKLLKILIHRLVLLLLRYDTLLLLDDLLASGFGVEAVGWLFLDDQWKFYTHFIETDFIYYRITFEDSANSHFFKTTFYQFFGVNSDVFRCGYKCLRLQWPIIFMAESLLPFSYS
jgi:hypothetical protein